MAFQTRTVLGVPEQLRTQLNLNLNRYSGYGFMMVTAFGLAQRSNLQTSLAWVDIVCWPQHWCDQSNLAYKCSAQYEQPRHFWDDCWEILPPSILFQPYVTPANLIEGKNITPEVSC